LKKLDISKNPHLTAKSYKELTTNLLMFKSKITHLSFEGNEIGDEITSDICKCLTELKNVHVLNLSKCGVTDYGAQAISEMLQESGMSLRTLLLHWNRIRGKGAVSLAKGVKHNNSLLILDASFNAFGSSSLKRKKGYKKPAQTRDRSQSKSPRKKAGDKKEEEEVNEDDEEFEKFT